MITDMDIDEDKEDTPPLSASGSDSDTETDFSESSSITNEIEQLIHDLEGIQRTHDQAIKQLQNLSSLLNTSASITIIVNGHMHDFCDILDDIHLQSLKEMGGFGKKILELIETSEIIVPNI